MDRTNNIINRIEQELRDLGYSRLSRSGVLSDSNYAIEETYFDLLLRLKLEGESIDLNPEDIFNDLKKEINRLTTIASETSKDYLKAKREIAALKRDYEELLRE